MRALITVLIAGLWLLVAMPAAAQVKIESTRPPDDRAVRVLPPPLHYETSRYSTPTSTGRVGVSGWTAPNQPVGSPVGGWRDVSGWFALGFSITWGGPPPPPAQKPAPR